MMGRALVVAAAAIMGIVAGCSTDEPLSDEARSISLHGDWSGVPNRAIDGLAGHRLAPNFVEIFDCVKEALGGLPTEARALGKTQLGSMRGMRVELRRGDAVYTTEVNWVPSSDDVLVNGGARCNPPLTEGFTEPLPSAGTTPPD